MLANQTEMDVVGNNIANANTTGFKGSTTNFDESFLQESRAATATDPVGLGVGLGVQVDSTSTNWSQGVFQTTNVPTDMGINGNGFFTVQTPAGQDYVTRNGAFVENSQGYLVTTDGNFVMGSATAPTGATAGFPTTQIQIPTTMTDGSAVASWTVDSTGAVTLTGADGTTQISGYITLQSYSNNDGLQDVGGGLYQYQPAAGTNQYFQADSPGVGSIQTGVLEASNVDLSTEFSNMIIAQRGFEASARVISVSDNMLQTVTNLTQGQ
jgi:flagellar hook protein FlgE